MDNVVTQPECKLSMERVHSRVDTVEKTSASIETSARTIEACVLKITNLMYGTENGEGIITKVSNLKQQLSGIYWLGGVIIVAFIGSLVAMIFKK